MEGWGTDALWVCALFAALGMGEDAVVEVLLVSAAAAKLSVLTLGCEGAGACDTEDILEDS